MRIRRWTIFTVVAAVTFLSGSLAPLPASAAFSFNWQPNFDHSRGPDFPNGDKPSDPCTFPSGWTELARGDSQGEVCENSSTEFQITALGTNDENDPYGAYKSCGTDDCQIIAQIPTIDQWIGPQETFTAFLVGISEGDGDNAWYMHAWITPDGRARCKAGTPGPDDLNTTAGANQLPEYLMVTHDDSNNELRCLQSNDGTTWTTYGQFFRDLAEPAIAYVAGTSHNAAASITTVIEEIDLSSTITGYVPADDPPPDPENNSPVCGVQDNISITQGSSLTLNVGGVCTDPDADDTLAYSAAGLPSGLSISSVGLITGAPTSPGLSTVTVTATDPELATDSFAFTVGVISSSGDVFTIPDVGDTTDSNFNCAVASGANGASWASIRTSGSGTTPGAGDTILITSGGRGDIFFQNCRGSPASPILFAKTPSATRLTFTGNKTSSGEGIVFFRDTVGVTIDGLINWTGHTGGCGSDVTVAGPSETPKTDCGWLIQGSSANTALRFRGERRFITIRGVEVDGDWPGGASSTGINYGLFYNDQQYCPGAPAQAPTNLNDTSSNWVEGLNLEDSYFHDLQASATYIGANIPLTCGGGVLTMPNQRQIHGKRLYFADVGANGWHVKRVPGSDPSQSIIEDSICLRVGGNSADTAAGANNRCFALYEASGTIKNSVSGDVVPDEPAGVGFICARQHRPPSFGQQVCRIQNSVTHDAQGHGINALNPSGGCCGASPGMKIEYDNNTVVNPGGACVNAGAGITGWIRNTLCVGNQGINGSVTQAGNGGGSEASRNFENAATEDYRLTTSSPDKDAGVGTSCPATDMVGAVRPQGTACSRGAFEK